MTANIENIPIMCLNAEIRLPTAGAELWRFTGEVSEVRGFLSKQTPAKNLPFWLYRVLETEE